MDTIPSVPESQHRNSVFERLPKEIVALLENGEWGKFGPFVFVGHTMIEAFVALSGDENPIHLDGESARRARFEGPVAHGMLLAIIIPRLDPLYRALVLESGLTVVEPTRVAKFRSPALSGTSIRARAKYTCRQTPEGALLQINYEISGADGEVRALCTSSLFLSTPEP